MKNYIVVCVCALFGLLLVSCASKGIKLSCLEKYDSVSLEKIGILPVNINELNEDIKAFKEKYVNSGGGLTEEKQARLRKDALDIKTRYLSLVKIREIADYDTGAIVVPPKTELMISVKSYCLDPHKASPKDNEAYILTSDEPQIPMYRDIMVYTNTKERVSGIPKQTLIWNIANEVKFEDLPPMQMALLTKIDVLAYLKLNSHLKDAAGNMLIKMIPGMKEAKKISGIIKGRVYDYNRYEDMINSLVSAEKLPFVCGPVKAEGYELYTVIKAGSFSNVTMTFINFGNAEVRVQGYLKPYRKDVQALGFDLPFVLIDGVEVIVTDEIIDKIKKAYEEIEKFVI